jgi:uncharacterized protein (TIGR02246 family)
MSEVAMDTHDNDLKAIKQIASDWREDWNNGDVETLLSLFPEDPVLMPQGQPAIVGKDTIRTMYESVFKDYTINGRGEVVKAEASGDLGSFWSVYTLTAIPRTGGEPITSRGKSLFLSDARMIIPGR